MDPFTFAFGSGGGFSFSKSLDNRVSSSLGPIDNRNYLGTSPANAAIAAGAGVTAGQVLLGAAVLLGVGLMLRGRK